MYKILCTCLSLLVLGTGFSWAITYSDLVIADNPISYWKLSETTGTTAVDQQNRNSATYVGSPTLGASGAISDGTKAITLGPGTDQYAIKSEFTSFPTTAITVEFWMRSSDTTNAGTPFSYAISTNCNEFLIYNYNSLAVYVNGAAVDSGIALTDGLWHQIAVTWRSSDGAVAIFKDGKSVYTNTLQTGSSIGGGGTLVLGQEQDSVGGSFEPTQRFIGSLDDVSVYNYVLSSTRISEHYQIALPEPSTWLLLSLAICAGLWTKLRRIL